MSRTLDNGPFCFWFLAGLTVVNFLYDVFCSKAYGPFSFIEVLTSIQSVCQFKYLSETVKTKLVCKTEFFCHRTIQKAI